MAVEMLGPSESDLVVDPACGTGGFLIIAMNHVIAKIRAKEQKRWRKGNATEHQTVEFIRKVQDYAQHRIVGLDINPDLVKASKMKHGHEQ